MGITRQQAIECCSSDDLIGIGMEADALRRTLHPEGVVSYVVNRLVLASSPDLSTKIAEALDLGATGIVLRAGQPFVASQNLPSLEQTLIAIRRQAPSLWIHGTSATEIVTLAANAGTSIDETILRLQAAGLGSLSGADAGILDDAVQSPALRCSTDAWLTVHRSAHRAGMPSTAAMLFGAGEALEHRINHLQALQQLQQETGGFTAIIPTAFQPSVAGVQGFEEATAVEYMRMLSITRMMLDIPNVEADWATQGLKVLQMALRFGANDIGSTLPTEALITPDGTTEEDLRRVIRGAGFRPVQRDTVYRTLFLD